MGNGISWRETDNDAKLNAEIAIGGTEVMEFTNSSQARRFSRMWLTNRSSRDLEVRLNGLVNNRFWIVGNGTMMIEPGDGIMFDMLHILNLDAANVVAADTVLVRVAAAERVA